MPEIPQRSGVLTEPETTKLRMTIKASEILASAIKRHDRFALQFSGGKDSLACLYLLKPWWDRLIVLWGNAGDEYPETREQMEQLKVCVAEFHEIRGYAALDNAKAFPVDLLPIKATELGRMIEPDAGPLMQSRYDCCWRNIYAPMTAKVKELGITLLIRGQRDDESQRAPIENGSLDPSGAEICLPIHDWTKVGVMAYLKEVGAPIPRQYQYGMASLGCMHCTAYTADSANKLLYLHDFHREAAKEYLRRMEMIRDEQAKMLRLVDIALCNIDGDEGIGD